MFEELSENGVVTCDGPACNRSLPEEPTIVFRTAAGERRAYECACGAVTVTVVRDA